MGENNSLFERHQPQRQQGRKRASAERGRGAAASS